MIDVAQQIRVWREKAAAGTLTREDCREAIILLRGDRKMSQQVQEIKKTRASPKDAKALLEDFAAQLKGEEHEGN